MGGEALCNVGKKREQEENGERKRGRARDGWIDRWMDGRERER